MKLKQNRVLELYITLDLSVGDKTVTSLLDDCLHIAAHIRMVDILCLTLFKSRIIYLFWYILLEMKYYTRSAGEQIIYLLIYKNNEIFAI